MSLKSREARKLAIASIAALAALGAGASSASAAKLSLDYKCTYPLIGPQDLHLDIDAIIPEVVQRNVTTPAFQINATATTTADTWDGIDIIGASTIEGTSDARASIALPGGFTLPVKVPIVVPVYKVPTKRGPLVILAAGKTPPLTFPTNGQAPITIKSIALNLIAKDSTGKILQLPPVDVDSDDDPDTFDVACVLNPATQSTLLTTITIQEGPVDTTPTTPVNVAPTAPGKPSIAGITNTGATVSWAASTDDVAVAGYDVFDGATKVGSTTTATTFALTGLAPGSNHSITVVARDGGTPVLSSPASAATTFTTTVPANQPPTAPGKPTIGSITTTGATASWTAATDPDGTVAGYDVFDGATKVGSTTTATTFALTGLAPGSNHSITVVAKDNLALAGPASAATTFTTATPANQPPSAPGKPTIGSITTTGATASWTAATDTDGTIASYDVFDGATKLATVTTTSYAITGLAPGSNHSITVSAKDDDGAVGPASAATTFTTATPANQPPSAPGKPTIGSITTTGATASWTAATDTDGTIASYDVFDGATKLATVTTTSYAITGLAPGSNHSITVSAKDDDGAVGPASAATAFTTGSPVNTAPTAPGTPVASAITSAGVTLTYGASTDDKAVTGYTVYNGAAVVGTSTTTTAVITGLTPETAYTLTVKAKDAEGLQSPASAPVTFTTLVQGTGPLPIKYSYSLAGTATLKTLVKGTLPLTGGIDAKLTLATGAFTADLQLNPTSGKLTALGFLPVTANVAFQSTAPVTGTLKSGVLSANAKVRIKLPKVSLAGITLAGGSGCQAKQISNIDLKSTDAFFQPLNGGTLAGNFAISDLVNCGFLTGIVSPLTKGSGNAIALKLTPRPVAF